MSTITRKPINTDDFALRFAANHVRPYDDEYASVSAGPAEWLDHKGREVKGTYLRHYNTDIAYISKDGLRMWISSKNWSSMTSKVLSSVRGAADTFGFKESVWAIRKRVGTRYYGGNIEFVMYTRSAKERDDAAGIYAKNFRKRPWSVWSPYNGTTHHGSAYQPITRETRIASPDSLWFKVLDASGRSFHGGSYAYDLPNGENPGAWTEPVNLALCSSGYHVTNRISAWGGQSNGNRVFVPECDGDGITEAFVDGDTVIVTDKAAFRSIRLVRELTLAEIKDRLDEERRADALALARA